MIAGYCFLQAYDDIMDGDRTLKGSLKNAITPQQHAADIMRQWQGYALRQPENGKYAFQAASDGAGAWDAGQPEKPLSDLPALAELFNQQLARLPSYTEAHAEVARLLQLMQADAVRAQTRQLYPQAQLQRHLQQTFISSLNLLFCAQQSTTRAEHIPHLAHALAWCSITRDWDDDLAHGIINIPAEVWRAAALVADERDGRVISRNPVIAAWLAEQKQRAEQDLREVFFRLPQIKRQDPAAAQIIGLFARSVRGFARKRYPKRFGEG